MSTKIIERSGPLRRYLSRLPCSDSTEIKPRLWTKQQEKQSLLGGRMRGSLRMTLNQTETFHGKTTIDREQSQHQRYPNQRRRQRRQRLGASRPKLSAIREVIHTYRSRPASDPTGDRFALPLWSKIKQNRQATGWGIWMRRRHTRLLGTTLLCLRCGTEAYSGSNHIENLQHSPHSLRKPNGHRGYPEHDKRL